MAYDYPYSEESYGTPSESYGSPSAGFAPWERKIYNARPADSTKPTRRTNLTNNSTYNNLTTPTRTTKPPIFHPDYDPQTRQIRRVTFQKATETIRENAPLYWALVHARVLAQSDHILGNLLIALPLNIIVLYTLSLLFINGSFRYLIFNIPVLFSVFLTLMACFIVEVNFLATKYSWKVILVNAVIAVVVAVIVAQIIGPPLNHMLGMGVWGGAWGNGSDWIIDRSAEFLAKRAASRGEPPMIEKFPVSIGAGKN